AGRVGRLLNSHRAYQVVRADDAATQARIWRGRKSAFPAVGRLAPDYLCMDGTIPRHKLAE
ncbi:MAG TPA: FAD-binding oxidoreductase, partial [Gammaproteobacteria bacterium]|nr:FAD-binding oxidoreductase [Gammaproteobacteria bacterium]